MTEKHGTILGWLTITAALALALGAAGCHRNEQSEDTTANRLADDSDLDDAARRAGQGGQDDDALSSAGSDQGSCDFQPVYFSYDESELDSAARTSLNNNTRCIQTSRPSQVAIIGMTDPRGTTEYNLGLGDRRARAAASYVTAQGVPQSTLSIRSAGEEYSSGTSESSWTQDRRADFEAE